MSDPDRVEAVTLDFFNTLVFHRQDRGRGRRLTEYVQARGYRPGPWDHGVLYRLFQKHAVDYSPDLTGPERHRYLVRLACRVFDELGVVVPEETASAHAERLWAILGPSSLEVFPDVFPTLESLRTRGVRLAVVSNWHCGLEHFLTELGLIPYFDHVVGSADCGVAKPDPRIFERASVLLGVASSRILHVGDTFEDDYVAARAAGYRVALLERRSGEHELAGRVIQSLENLWSLPEFGVGRPVTAPGGAHLRSETAKNIMRNSGTRQGSSASRMIDERIEELGDWRGEMLSRLRALIKQADPEVVEEWKWRGVPVWSHDGLICTGETYRNVVKMTFASGAALEDPSGLFNASLDGNTRRAIDFHEGDEIDEEALKALVRAAVTLNASRAH